MPSRYVITNEPGWLASEEKLTETFKAWGVDRKAFRVTRSGPAVTIRWRPKGDGDTVELASSDQDTADKNLHKLALGLEALRMQERRGFASIASSYYAQTTALVEHASTRASRYAPYEVLGLQATADRETVDAVVRSRQMALHKKGGDEAEARRINDARAAIFEERGWR